MKSIRWIFLLGAAVAATAVAPRDGRAFNVDLSVNVFPTSLANPNGGGTWNMVAKTDAPLGIAGISVFLTNVNTSGLMVEPDINSLVNGGNPYNGIFNGAVNILYGQDLSSFPIVAGVGTPSFSDGPDPLLNPFWNGATKILKGTYSGAVPAFGSAAGHATQANTLQSTTPGTAAQAATVNTQVVRVQVPEPATCGLALIAAVGLAAMRRRRAR